MPGYRLILYWWSDGVRTPGGDYPIPAGDDAEAAAYAIRELDEPLTLADQCEIVADDGRLVWRNEWPPGGRGDAGGLKADLPVIASGGPADIGPALAAAARETARWGQDQLEQLLAEIARVLPGGISDFEPGAEGGGVVRDAEGLAGFAHGRMPIGFFRQDFIPRIKALTDAAGVAVIPYADHSAPVFRVDPKAAQETLGWIITEADPSAVSASDLLYQFWAS